MTTKPTPFELHPRLAADSLPVKTLGLCELRLINDSRWPWLILVPRRPDTVEFHDMTGLDQTMLTFELGLVSKPFKALTGCDKLNIAMIGNMVPQLHAHIVARSSGDANWPGPVWGFGEAVAYEPGVADAFIDDLVKAVFPL
ncbi:HIT domain-containing protein [Fulvimarina endophytica]|uniref:HIT domain-containing protein n=1 Tax=Fulvimarina endophytica TaxID=2293836 RepID=A0A371X1R3_9HYPH|nr:HIT family protein [Fulvimarina endophytica]RFC63178.1 HIT domain-containing protein [Fulvimarina endophytica]